MVLRGSTPRASIPTFVKSISKSTLSPTLRVASPSSSENIVRSPTFKKYKLLPSTFSIHWTFALPSPLPRVSALMGMTTSIFSAFSHLTALGKAKLCPSMTRLPSKTLALTYDASGIRLRMLFSVSLSKTWNLRLEISMSITSPRRTMVSGLALMMIAPSSASGVSRLRLP